MLFIIDFDGTLSVKDTVDTMLERFADPAWKEVEDAWLDGKIDAMTCMRQQLRMVNADHVTLSKFFRGIQLDASFVPFFKYVKTFANLAIVSDGLDYAIKTAMRNAEISNIPIYANTLLFEPRGIDIAWPHQSASCKVGNGVCKCAVTRSLTEENEITVLIGDGKSDACLSSEVNVVFAKDSLAKYCEQQKIPYTKFQTFADVLVEIKSWSPKQRTVSPTFLFN